MERTLTKYPHYGPVALKLVWIHQQAVMIYRIDLSAISCVNIPAEDERNVFPHYACPYLSHLQSALRYVFALRLEASCDTRMRRKPEISQILSPLSFPSAPPRTRASVSCTIKLRMPHGPPAFRRTLGKLLSGFLQNTFKMSNSSKHCCRASAGARYQSCSTSVKC